MTFNKSVFIAIVSFSNFLESICAAENSNPDDVIYWNNLPMWWENSTYDVPPSESSSSTLSGKKRSRTEMDPAKGTKELSKKYYKSTLPIDPEIENEKYGILSDWEKKILAGGLRCKWENFTELKKEDAKDLCIEAWKIQAQRIPEIKKKLQNDFVPDCEPILAAGVGDNRYKKAYKGSFHYLKELKDEIFLPDLIRCNCAYLKQVDRRNIPTTVNNTKKFFFLQKASGALYYIHTLFGHPTNNNVKLVDVCELKVHKS